RALLTAPLLSSPGCQYETAPNSSRRSKPTSSLPGLIACEPCARASETAAFPTSARQDAENVLPRAVSVRVADRRNGSLWAFLTSCHRLWVKDRERVGGLLSRRGRLLRRSPTARVAYVPLHHVRAEASSLALAVRTCDAATRPAWSL